jgi:hypothetical protein
MQTQKMVTTLLATLAILALLASPSLGSKKDLGRVVLEGVEFGQDTAVLKKSSLTALQPLLDELKGDPHLSVTLEVYYDSRQSEDKNLKLSKARAQVLFNWLTANGIDASRIRYTGRGAAQPVADRHTAEGRAKNSRVEIVKTRDVYPAVEVPVKSFNFEPVVDGTEVYHDFLIRNAGTSPLHINDVRTG